MEQIKEATAATAAQIKKYFEFTTMKEFKDEWDRLTDEEKSFYRQEVGKVLDN